ncbi:MAG: metallophosphoesterase, partial [Pseudomonadota bacterium]
MNKLLQIASFSVLIGAGYAAATTKAVADIDSNQDAGQIVAFGDVHGGYQELRALLEALEIIDAEGTWIGGRTRLVSLGDLLDRGPDSRQVMDLLMRLEAEAEAAGGAFHLVLGNHEIMNLVGDLRYVAREEYAAFAAEEDPAVRAAAERADAAARETAAAAGQTSSAIAPGEALPKAPFEQRYPPGFFGHRAAFRPNGHYGRWLLSKSQILILEDKAFVHGGLSSYFVTKTAAAFNAAAKEELTA